MILRQNMTCLRASLTLVMTSSDDCNKMMIKKRMMMMMMMKRILDPESGILFKKTKKGAQLAESYFNQRVFPSKVCNLKSNLSIVYL